MLLLELPRVQPRVAGVAAVSAGVLEAVLEPRGVLLCGPPSGGEAAAARVVALVEARREARSELRGQLRAQPRARPRLGASLIGFPPRWVTAIGSPSVRLGEHPVLTGSSLWTDRTLTRTPTGTPRRTMSAEERLRYYASQFPLTEIDSTYYAPPARAAGAPVGAADARGLSLRCEGLFAADRSSHPSAQPVEGPARAAPPPSAGKRNIYAKHLEPDALEEAWARFAAALAPLREAGQASGPSCSSTRGGSVPGARTARSSRRCASACPATGSRSSSARRGGWRQERDRGRTLGALEEHGLVFVGVDAPKVSGLPRVLAVTNPELFMVRFHGRSDSTWSDTSRSAAERFRYLYSEPMSSRSSSGRLPRTSRRRARGTC